MSRHIDTRTENTEGQALTVGQWVANHPQSARVFESHNIDYCCGGRRSLEDVCSQKGLDAAALKAELDEALRESSPKAGTDWRKEPLGALVDHIESTHHGFIRAERPRLTALAQKVARVHGSRHRELMELAAAVDRVFLQLDPHLDLEENVFFPACRNWENAAAGTAPDKALIDGVSGLEDEHVEMGQILETIRHLTNGFRPPEDACNSYLALFHGLEELEADLHEHIHKENNILHSRILAALGKAKEKGTHLGSCCDG